MPQQPPAGSKSSPRMRNGTKECLQPARALDPLAEMRLHGRELSAALQRNLIHCITQKHMAGSLQENSGGGILQR